MIETSPSTHAPSDGAVQSCYYSVQPAATPVCAKDFKRYALPEDVTLRKAVSITVNIHINLKPSN